MRFPFFAGAANDESKVEAGLSGGLQWEGRGGGVTRPAPNLRHWLEEPLGMGFEEPPKAPAGGNRGST